MLQHSSKYKHTPTIFSGNVVTVSLCSSSQGRESLQKREAQHALLLQRINYQSQAQQRNRSTLFIRQVWSQLHIQNAASIFFLYEQLQTYILQCICLELIHRILFLHQVKYTSIMPHHIHSRVVTLNFMHKSREKLGFQLVTRNYTNSNLPPRS